MIKCTDNVILDKVDNLTRHSTDKYMLLLINILLNVGSETTALVAELFLYYL